MASPFTSLLNSASGSSPPPFPLPSPSPLTQTNPPPNPSAFSNTLGSLAGLPGLSTLPALSSSPSALLLNPSFSPLPLPLGSTPAQAFLPPPPPVIPVVPPAPVVAAPKLGGPRSEIDLDEILRAMDQAKLLLSRIETVLLEKQRLEGEVFSSSSGESAGLLSLQSEYTQLLNLLATICTTQLLGALPVPLSAALSAAASSTNPTGQPQSTEVPGTASVENAGQTSIPRDDTVIGAAASEQPLPSMDNLAVWAENQAALDFSRRDSVRAGARAVLDVLRSGQT